MKIWTTQPVYQGIDGDTAQFAVLMDGSDSFICIRAEDRIGRGSHTLLAMTADQAEAFARDLLDAAMSLQGGQADD